MIKNNDRESIRRKITKMVLIINFVAIFILSAIAIICLNVLKSRSETTLINEMCNNAVEQIKSKAKIADIELQKYSDYISRGINFIDIMYERKENFQNAYVLPPNTTLKNEYSMQRYLENDKVNLSEIDEEISLLGNIKSSWNIMMTNDGNVISTVYLGTESGFMLAYDKNANLAELSLNGESYFEYKNRDWYTNAKKTGGPIFSDVTKDAYGRGLTLTCSAPFFNKGKFAGVLAMDILVTDLSNVVIDVDMGDGSYAFLVNKSGEIFASPYISLDQDAFENINNENNKYYSIKNNILSGIVTNVQNVNDEFYVAYAPIDIADWIICLYLPKTLMLAPILEIDRTIRILIITFIICFLILIFMIAEIVRNFSKKITDPILKLKNEVMIISDGDLSKKVEVIGSDEISDLATAFNNMTDDLKKYINDLTNITAEKERIGAELNIATKIQSSILPNVFPAFPTYLDYFNIYATMSPAKEVGGDFYDFFMIDDKHMAIVIADVSGKGIPAALFMVIGKTLIKDHTTIKNGLNTVFEEVNNLLCSANSEGLFITAFEAIINLETGNVIYVNAGHEKPFIIHKNGSVKIYDTLTNFVLAGMDNIKYKIGEFKLEIGDRIFEYTDGVTEAINNKKELYGIKKLENILIKNKNLPIDTLLSAVKNDIDDFAGVVPQFDDITMICFELKKLKK